MAKQDLTSKIDKLDLFEERAGVRLEAMSALIEDEGNFWLEVYGEIHAYDGNKLNNDVQLTLSIYDSRGRMIAMDTEKFFAENFFGFEPFEFLNELHTLEISKIRVIPKPIE